METTDPISLSIAHNLSPAVSLSILLSPNQLLTTELFLLLFKVFLLPLQILIQPSITLRFNLRLTVWARSLTSIWMLLKHLLQNPALRSSTEEIQVQGNEHVDSGGKVLSVPEIELARGKYPEGSQVWFVVQLLHLCIFDLLTDAFHVFGCVEATAARCQRGYTLCAGTFDLEGIFFGDGVLDVAAVGCLW
jgi:hypothetical protein